MCVCVCVCACVCAYAHEFMCVSIYHTYPRNASIGIKFPSGEEAYDFQFAKWMTREKVYYMFTDKKSTIYPPQNMIV